MQGAGAWQVHNRLQVSFKLTAATGKWHTTGARSHLVRKAAASAAGRQDSDKAGLVGRCCVPVGWVEWRQATGPNATSQLQNRVLSAAYLVHFINCLQQAGECHLLGLSTPRRDAVPQLARGAACCKQLWMGSNTAERLWAPHLFASNQLLASPAHSAISNPM